MDVTCNLSPVTVHSMKLRPALFLFLFILADAFFKHSFTSIHPTYLAYVCFLLLLACGAYLLIFFGQSEVLWRPGLGPAGRASILVVTALILFGALLRFWRLDHLFDGLFWDEAYKGLDAIAIREFGER